VIGCVLTGALLGRLLGHVMLCLCVLYWSSVRQVSRPRHVVFCCAELVLALQVAEPRHVLFCCAVLELR
jgi:hypothetical protein